jgi:hypothetical protein
LPLDRSKHYIFVRWNNNTIFFDSENITWQYANVVLVYMPTVPNWAYNGAARRYFDEAVNNTEFPDIMRITNHYGSGINSIPVLDRFRRNPSDDYLLRVGYAGMNQLMANIDSEGFGSGDFDCDPAILKFDSYTADYGIGFADYVRNAGLSLSRARKTRRKLICVLISRHWAIYQLTSGRCFRTGRNCRPMPFLSAAEKQ